MPSLKDYARNANAYNANNVPPVPDYKVQNAELQNVIEILSRSVANKNNQQVLVPTYKNGRSILYKVQHLSA